MSPTRFGIIGGGWRAEFFLRIAHALPERFHIPGMVVRDAAKGKAIEDRWGLPTHRSIDALLAGAEVDFVVVCVASAANAGVLQDVVQREVPALSETPPGQTLEELHILHALTEVGAKVQVAEQYIFQPLHAARLAIVESGKLGAVTQAQVSAAHGYHGVSLIRHFLGVRCEECTVRATSFTSPIVAGPGRDGPPTEEKVKGSAQTIAWLDFGDRLGVFDFAGDQYFSWVRSPRVLVRGEKGEINGETVRFLPDFRTPITLDLRREDAGQQGNLEGCYHKGYLAGSAWAYRNPFAPGRLTDDEIAIATSLAKMGEYVAGGASFYSLADASQDRYLDLLIQDAAKTGEAIVAAPQPWSATG